MYPNSIPKQNPLNPQAQIDPHPAQPTSSKLLKTIQRTDSLDNFHHSHNGSNLSDLRISFTTEEIGLAQRQSVHSDDITELNFNQFNFENKIQNKLSPKLRFCNQCKCKCYCIEKFVLQNLNFLQFIVYWLHSLKCCSDPKLTGKYLIRKVFCVYCGTVQED